MNNQNQRHLFRFIAMTSGLLVFGTVALSRGSHIGYGEAFYQTLIILLTHFDHYGFREPFSRMVVVILVLASLVLIAYLLKWFAEYMIELSGNVKKLKVKASIDKLKNHYIVCGMGRVGSQIAHELANEGVKFVVLERDKTRYDEALEKGYLALNLDSTEEEALTQAGITRAKGLVASLGEDSHNLFVTLAAKSLNPDLFVVARANREASQTKLKRAGADRVAMPYQIGGFHMAAMVLRPSVVDYFDIVSNSNGTTDLEVEEMVVGEHSSLAGHRLGQTFANGTNGATVVAINGVDGNSKIKPSGDEMIYAGDRLILLGAKPDLSQAAGFIR